MSEGMLVFHDQEYDARRCEVEKLRISLSMLVLERDELRYITCKNIETQYMLRFGTAEYKVYQAECTYLRLKRQLELIQMRLNRQEAVDLWQIECTLNLEFVEYQRILDEKIDSMNEAIRRSQYDVLSEEETRELKQLYRKIVKALHPDFHPDLTERQKELFSQAVEAYKNGDLDTLRLIDAMLTDDTMDPMKYDSLAALQQEKIRLEQLLKRVAATIEKIKSEYPYTLKELVENEKKAAEYLKELQEMLDSYQAAILLLQHKIDELLRGNIT